MPASVPDAPVEAPAPGGTGVSGGAVAEWRRGWPVVAAAMVGPAFGPGLFQNLSSLFVPSLQHEFGWTRGGIATATGTALVAGLAAPFLGRLADRFGVRPLIVAAMLAVGAVHVGFAAMSGAMWHFQLLVVALVLTVPGASSLVYGKVIAARFRHSRGLALAVSTSGLAIATLFMPPIVARVIAGHGWRTGFVVLAACAVLVALPLVLLGLRGVRDGGAAGADSAAAPETLEGVTAAEARRDPRFWRMVAGALFINFATVGLVTQIVPLGIERGLGPGGAALLLTAFGASQLAGRLAIGVLIDRYPPQPVAAGIAIISGAAFALLMVPVLPLPALLALVFLAGLMNGAENDLLPFLTARVFGLRAFAEVYGSGVPFGLVGAGLGIVAFGRLHDVAGSYWPALLAATAAMAATAWCFATLAERALPHASRAARAPLHPPPYSAPHPPA